MKSVNELLKLFMRQAELEGAMRQPRGARVIEQRELSDASAAAPEDAQVAAAANGRPS